VDGAPDPELWTHRNASKNWRNNEQQQYTDSLENSRVEDGVLIIEARKTDVGYTSARLRTQFHQNWTYGRIEVMAKIPQGKGNWSAIWMLPKNAFTYGTGWPHSGEIDIMENVGFDQNNIHSTIHTGKYNHTQGTQITNSVMIPDADTAFHLYAVDWYPDRLEFFIDDEMVFLFENEGEGWISWPYDIPFYLLLNVAVGGDWGGAHGIDDSSFPWKMEVDYVRYYGPVEEETLED
jgi:beta-glucanase (GH16 family)